MEGMRQPLQGHERTASYAPGHGNIFKAPVQVQPMKRNYSHDHIATSFPPDVKPKVPPQTHSRPPVYPQHHFATVPLKSKTDLKPGDILLTYIDGDDAPFYHTITKFAQQCLATFTFSKKTGDPNLIHAQVWKKNHQEIPLEDDDDAEVVEARNYYPAVVLETPLQAGLHKIYRPNDEVLARRSARTGTLWAQERTIPYSMSKAVGSVFRSMRFTPAAQELAKRFAKEAETSRPSFAHDGAFCSDVVMRFLQAGALSEGRSLEGALRVNTAAVTPCNLDMFLSEDTKQFQLIGHVVV